MSEVGSRQSVSGVSTDKPWKADRVGGWGFARVNRTQGRQQQVQGNQAFILEMIVWAAVWTKARKLVRQLPRGAGPGKELGDTGGGLATAVLIKKT